MKKKILSLVLILMLVSTMFVLTGCGETEEISTSKDNSSSENSDTTESKTSQEEKLKESTEETLKVTSVSSDENPLGEYLYVKDENSNYHIVDYDGKILYTEGTTKSVTMETVCNGYITIYPCRYAEQNKIDLSKIQSKIIEMESGETILEGENEFYSEVSDNGYVVSLTVSENLSGTEYIYKIIDLQGNTIYDSTEDKIEYVDKDYFTIYSEDNNLYTLLNAKTGESTEYSDNGDFSFSFPESLDFGIGMLYAWSSYDYFIVNSDTSKGEEIEDGSEDKTYFSYDGTTYVSQYKSGEKYLKVSTFDGATIMEINKDNGGVEHCNYADGVFTVISTTGYFYTFDLSGQYIVEPVKLTDLGFESLTNASYSSKLVNDVFVQISTKGVLKCYNGEGETAKEVDFDTKVSSFTQLGDSYVIYLSNNGSEKVYIDLRTLEEFVIYK